MMGLEPLYPERFHLIWVVLAVAVVLLLLELRANEHLDRFLSRVMQRRLAFRQSLQRRLLRVTLIALSLGLGVVALTRPQTQGVTETLTSYRASADIMVVLDVSRSMLAEDTAPNRLGRAKAEVREVLQSLRGHRVGLVAFAGRAVLMCPLTSDHAWFSMTLRDTDTTVTTRGGSRIGDGIRAAIEAFGPGERPRLIILVTDGEDHDSFPLDAAEEARQEGIRIVAIGFGSEDGTEITISDPETGAESFLTDNSGNVVISHLDGETLRDIALRTEGAYIPAGVAALDLDSIVTEHIEPLTRDAAAISSVRHIPGEQYTWFTLGALFALMAAVWTGSSGQRRGLV